MISVLFQNFAVAAILAGAYFLYRAARRREQWRAAFRQLRANRLAVAALAVISLYASIGILDSVVWRDPLREASGEPARDPAGRKILAAQPRSLLDRLCSGLTSRKERTYSAPLASRQYSMESVETPGGGFVREYPALRHPRTHLMGTDRVGIDVLYQGLKGARTALIIGGLSTLLIIPLAVIFGVSAGYFGRRVDDVIQYIYTTLASIPDILLIVAFMMLTGRGLVPLCVILGITSWTGLCRLLRAETLKLRELEYVQAARALGLSHLRVMARHILPNVMHIILIAFVLRFSGLVFTEAVLSYLGIGVDPSNGSWGHMINAARQELSRDPVVWWNLAAAFTFMFGLVLPVNLFGDALRDALDPKLRTR